MNARILALVSIGLGVVGLVASFGPVQSMAGVCGAMLFSAGVISMAILDAGKLG